MPKKDRIRNRLLSLKEPYKTQGISLYEKHYDEFRSAKCSAKYHGAYEGALYNHTDVVMHLADDLYLNVNLLCEVYKKPIDFTKDEAIFGAFLHDFAKPWQQRLKGKLFQWHYVLIEYMLEEDQIVIPDNMLLALKMHHGGWSKLKLNMNLFAIYLHLCDMIASQHLEIEEVK